MVVGKRGCSYKFVGRINDGTDRYVSVVLGRTGDVALRTARERSTELRLALRRGEDPRTPKASVPTVAEALDRYLEGRTDLSPRTQQWYRQKIEGPLRSLAKLPADRVDREWKTNAQVLEDVLRVWPEKDYDTLDISDVRSRMRSKDERIPTDNVVRRWQAGEPWAADLTPPPELARPG